MQRSVMFLTIFAMLGCVPPSADAENCLSVTLTGTMGGPMTENGLAGAGTLVRYGSNNNECGDLVLQFDAGRGTNMSLSKLGLSANDLDAVFFTHMHSDHVAGFEDILQTRWHFLGGSLDVVCSEDVTVPLGDSERTVSCARFVDNVAIAHVQSGEISQRLLENPKRDPAGPGALARFMPVDQSQARNPVEVWRSGDLSVSAIASPHIPGHLSYRVDTPHGSVVIGGDAGNAEPAGERAASTADSVEQLTYGADILVHSTIHPVFAPGGESNFPPVAYLRQSTAADLGALAKRAGVRHLMLTHLIPALDAKSHGPYEVPGGPLDAEDYRSMAKSSGYKGTVHVGVDGLVLRLMDSS